MTLALLFEYVATFMFFYVIASVGEPIAVAAAFLGAVFFSSAISGANLNPAVSFMMYLLGKLSAPQFLQYSLVHLLAAATVVLLRNPKMLMMAH